MQVVFVKNKQCLMNQQTVKNRLIVDFPVLSSLNEGVIGPSSGGNDSNTNINLQLSLTRNKYSRLIIVRVIV